MKIHLEPNRNRNLLLVAGLVACAAIAGCLDDGGEVDDLGDAEPDEDTLVELEQAAVTPATLRVGMGGTVGDEIFGRGPTYTGGQWTTLNPYTMVLGRIPPQDLAARIVEAQQKGIVIVLNMAGSRNAWTNEQIVNGQVCKMYDVGKFKARVNEYVGVPGLSLALAQRRIVLYVVDEPNIDDFCNSISPTEANAMGRYMKQKWPGAITMIRSGGEVLTNGFAGQGPLGPTFWTGFDYGWGTYKGWMKQKQGKSAAVWYAEEKQRLKNLHLGMVYAVNILDHGEHACWDYLNNGTSSGRVRGDNQAQAGAGVSCAQGLGNELNWLASPTFLRSIVTVAMQDPDAPFIAMWTHIAPDGMYQEFKPYEIRSDFVNAYRYMIARGKQRTTWNGWRPAK